MDGRIKQESVEYQSPLLRMKIWEIRRGRAPLPATPARVWHYHPEAEFVVVLEGSLELLIEEERLLLGPGDVAVVGPSQLHTSRAAVDGDVRQIVCQFDLNVYLDAFAAPYSIYFASPAQPLGRLNRILRERPALNRRIAEAVMAMYDESERKPLGYELAVSMHMKSVLLALLRCGDGKLPEADFAALQLLKPALLYVDAHYADRVDLRTASRRANLSYHYVSRLFRKTLGMSFTQYVNRKRVQEAQRLLVVTDKNVIDVGAEVGMGNAAHFFETFKKLNGCSPSDYRRRYRDPAADHNR